MTDLDHMQKGKLRSAIYMHYLSFREFVARTVPSTILRTNFAGRSCKQRTSLTD